MKDFNIFAALLQLLQTLCDELKLEVRYEGSLPVYRTELSYDAISRGGFDA